MTYGFIYRVNDSHTLARSVWSSKMPHMASKKPTAGVVPVHVRIRQQDVGFLYQTNGGIRKIPLASYQAGENLDFYA